MGALTAPFVPGRNVSVRRDWRDSVRSRAPTLSQLASPRMSPRVSGDAPKQTLTTCRVIAKSVHRTCRFGRRTIPRGPWARCSVGSGTRGRPRTRSSGRRRLRLRRAHRASLEAAGRSPFAKRKTGLGQSVLCSRAYTRAREHTGWLGYQTFHLRRPVLGARRGPCSRSRPALASLLRNTRRRC